ncbi:MAG: RIP metalloprotease RseP [Bacteroidetes bacterium]|nr:RIP metalloprotease RseP [Bacteroidota bacterium]MCY4205425.1 RIP metalloprotease RseP [Bacteroidota bacterium]
MNLLWILFTFIPALMILVFVHELGHFWAARAFGMRVDRFSIGFPPNILKKRFGQTEYVLGLTPLGGYVKIAGMVDESLDTDFGNEEPQPDEFRSKPLWQRMIVISAGVIMNMILALVIFFALTWGYGSSRIAHTEDATFFVADSSVAALDIGMQTGDRLVSIGDHPYTPDGSIIPLTALLTENLMFEVERESQRLTLPGPENLMTRIQEQPTGGLYGLGIYNWPSILGSIVDGMPADLAGMQPGDRITSVNGTPIRYWPELTDHVSNSNGDSLLFTWVREEEQIPVEHEAFVVPVMNANCDYVIGIRLQLTQINHGPFESAAIAWSDTWNNTRTITTSLWRIAAGKESVRENLGGPVMVANVIGEAASSGARPFWHIVAVLSITLAIVNILPIPVLDGGHLVFLFYELIARREPPMKVRIFLQQIGMILLLILMAFLITNDVIRAFSSRGNTTVAEPAICQVDEVEQTTNDE